MANTLAKTLVEQRLATPEAVQEALQRQVVHGGSLDTILLELEVVSEANLLTAMGTTFDMPAADRSDIDAIGEHIPRLFPLVFAESYHLGPFRLIGQNLGVLVSGPAEEQLYGRIRDRLKLHVQPTVTTELRLRYAMNRLYGTELLPRFRTLLERIDGEAPAPTSESTGGHVLSWGLSSGRVPSRFDTGDRPSEKRKAVDVDALLARLAAASDRDTIVDVLLEVTLSTFEFAALFIVQGDAINGWRAADPESTQRVARISVPIEMPSVFQTIYATHGHYLGPLPTNSVNMKLIDDLGRQAPRTAFLAPLRVGGKLAAIVYADNGSRGVPSKRVSTILLLTHRAGMCLQALIQRRKAAEERPADVVRAETRPSVADDETPPPSAEDDHGDLELLDDDQFHPIIEPPPPLPVSDQPPAMEAVTSGNETAEENDSKLWNSVTFDDADSTEATGTFTQDSSPEAAEADFNAGIAASAGDEEQISVEVEVEPEQTTQEEGYVVFSDVDESPQETVSDWEDVFVETVGIDKPIQAELAELLGKSNRANDALAAGDEKPAPPPAVTWDDVIAEASAAPELVSATTSTLTTVEVAGTVMDEREILLDSLDAADPETWKPAVARLAQLGSAIDDIIAERFPGEIRFDPFATHINLPPFSQCSGITALLTARGSDAATIVLPHLESNDRVKRFFAVYYLYAVHYPPALELLARRIYDSEPRNRFLAADALRAYRPEPAYLRIVQGLRDHLKIPVVETQVATVQILGQLRDPSCVPSLIPLVVSRRQALARASASALTVICAQAYGPNVTQWAEWWQTHFNKPREAWLVEGMRHTDQGVRRIAAREFQLLTGRLSPKTSSASIESHSAQPPA
ncbi:MAG: hypothetical protein V3T05_11470 [Myxococcota bacterium]